MDYLFARLAVAAAAIACASACSEIEGATSTLTTTGPVNPATSPTQIFTSTDHSGKPVCTVSSLRQDQVGLFQVAYACAWHQADRVARGAVDFEDPTAQRAYRTMLREGLGLVRGNCADFFRLRGDRQQTVNFARDVVAIGGTTAGAIIGLTGGSALAMSIIALSGATLYGAMDVYTKNFLFGVENIESVRTLTMQTLSDNATQLLAMPEPLSFQGVAGAIADNQEICKPASIAAAVRLKLRGGGGGIEAAGESAFARSQLDAARAAAVNAWMGAAPGVVLDETRLAAACWATTPEGMEQKNLDYIRKSLLPDTVYKFGPGTGNWPGTSVRVAGECAGLSAVMQNVIKARTKEFRDLIAGKSVTEGIDSTARPAGALPRAQGLQPFVPMMVR